MPARPSSALTPASPQRRLLESWSSAPHPFHLSKFSRLRRFWTTMWPCAERSPQSPQSTSTRDGLSLRNPSSSKDAIDGYRGVYHRARIRATRWLHPSVLRRWIVASFSRRGDAAGLPVPPALFCAPRNTG
jgi:hypothetical protein